MKSGMRKAVDKFIGAQKFVSFLLILFIPILVVIQVFLRYVFKAPLMGVEELLLFPTIWIYMIGGANASQERSHISCGILTLYIKKARSKQLFNIVKALLSLLISIWLLYWNYWFFIYSFTRWKLSDLLYIPMFLGESAMFIGVALMTVYTAVELFDHIKTYLKKNKPTNREGSGC
ncbi:TRAP transporter small permease [Clostridiaceae bacterium 35-E11]